MMVVRGTVPSNSEARLGLSLVERQTYHVLVCHVAYRPSYLTHPDTFPITCSVGDEQF